MLNRNLMVAALGLLLLAVGGARAQALVSARILASEGQVELRRQVQKIAFKLSDELNAGDTIITGKNGRLVLGLSDGSQAVIAPQTTVVIQDLSQSPRTLFQLLRGKTRVKIEKLGGQPNPYRVNTPTAVIAVRGTLFDVLVKENETEVFLHEGAVTVFNLALPAQPVLLAPGQTTRVERQRQPRQPDAFKPGRNDDSFRSEQQRREERQSAKRRTNTDFGHNAASTQREREGARPEARPDAGRGANNPAGGARPNTNPGGRRP
jgi:hypothetical protein